MLMEVTPVEKPRAYAPKDASRLLGISERKLDELIRTKSIRSFKVGKSRRISAEAITEFIEYLEPSKPLAISVG
jgi:excisionase family DNA binding protein